MRAADDDLRALDRLADLDDVGLDAGVGVGAFVGDLLGLGQQGLDPAEVQQRVAAVGLLDDAGDDVALAACVLFVLELALGLADALHHDLLGGLRGDAAEVVGGDVELVAHGLAVLVELLGQDPDVHRIGVDGDPGVLVGVGHALVGGFECVGERCEQRVDRDPLVGCERLERLHHLGVHRAAALLSGSVAGSDDAASRSALRWARALALARLGGGAPLEHGDGLGDVVVVDAVRERRRRRAARRRRRRHR